MRRVSRSKDEIGERTRYLRRWTLMGVAIGAASAAGALFLIAAVKLVSAWTLGAMAGLTPPEPGGEAAAGYVYHVARPWAIPLVMGAGGLVGGLLVWWLAPETAGVGTNAAIRAFHQREEIPLRTPILKVVTSAITIGTGMTSGREGPIAQIGAGTGSWMGRVFRLTPRERNIALAAGLGAGISAMFKAPLAGAIIGAEIWYAEDFEVEALIPAIIASVVGYAIVGYFVGFQPIFALGRDPAAFDHPATLLLYAALGVACAIAARALFAVFFPTQRFFRRFPLPVATTVGGLLTGLVALAVPSVVGTGYGWVQLAILNDYSVLGPLMLLAAAGAEIVCASLTLGSGNSGGIFGPSVVIGGLLGASFGAGAAALFPGVVSNPATFAIVGMVAFFAATAKAPISTIIMISEMTGGYGLLAPALVAVAVAFLLSGHGTIFPAQVRTRLQSPAHAEEFRPLRLREVRVADAMTREPLTIDPDVPVSHALDALVKARVGGLPVLEEGRLVGMITRTDALNVRDSARARTPVREAMTTALVTCHPDEDLFTVLDRLIVHDVGRLPVVERHAPDKLVGLLRRADVRKAVAATEGPAAPAAEPGPAL